MLMSPFFSCFLPCFLFRWTHIFIHKSRIQSANTWDRLLCTGLLPSAEDLQSWIRHGPLPQSSHRSGGQEKLTGVECDLCCHRVFRMFRMSDPVLICCMTQVCLAFYFQASVSWGIISCISISVYVSGISVLCLTHSWQSLTSVVHTKVDVCFYSLLSMWGRIDWISGLKTFLTVLPLS